MKLKTQIPRWAVPLENPLARSLGAKGGRGGGKSHYLAEKLVKRLVANRNVQAVCIREIQRSLKFSAKKLIESKIKKLGVGHLFQVQDTEIRRRGGEGIIIFQGMQDHTAESIKSLEGFDIAWCEEAQSLSARSLELLEPTIRKDGSQLWFSWNPDQPDDAVEEYSADADGVEHIVVHVNFYDNPWCPQTTKNSAEKLKRKDFERYQHVYLGGYNTKSDAQIFAGYWRVDEFEPEPFWNGPYQGLDFGFSQDPFMFVRCWEFANVLYIEYALGDTKVEIDKMGDYILSDVADADEYPTQGDSARPESISYLQRNEMPLVEGVEKWPGSVEDGIEFIKTFDEIVIHERCKPMQEEARKYSYVVDKRTGKVTRKIADENNHAWDAVRYALVDMIKQGCEAGVVTTKRHKHKGR